MVAVNVSLIRLILTCSLKYHSTVTDANAQRTHLTKRRTQAIAQRTKGGFTGLMGTDTDPTGNTVVPLCVSTVRHNYVHRTGATLDAIHRHTKQEQQLYNIGATHNLRPLSYVTRDV